MLSTISRSPAISLTMAWLAGSETRTRRRGAVASGSGVADTSDVPTSSADRPASLTITVAANTAATDSESWTTGPTTVAL